MSDLRISGKASLAALVMAASMTVASTSSMAAVVCGSAGLPLTVPANGVGIYINFVTGAISATAMAGWDFNPFGTTALSFFTSGSAANTSALVGGATLALTPSVLAAGTPIGPTSTFGPNGSGTNPAWRAGVTGQFVGVRFANETLVPATTLNYGWVQMNTTGTTGHPATVTAYCYENSGQPIIAGTLPVALQQFSVE